MPIPVPATAAGNAPTRASQRSQPKPGARSAMNCAPAVTAQRPPNVTKILDSDAMAGETLGAVLPLGMLLGSLVLTRGRFRLLSNAAALAVLAGSFAMRVRVLAEGDQSARRPDVSMGFAQPG